MFSLLDESQRFLSLAHSNSILTLPNIELLQRVIQEHNYRYYIDSDPVISDQEWDVLFAYLLRSEEQAGQVFENSPTNRFVNALSRQFSKGIHDEPMISLANTYNAEDLLDFNTRINNELGV
jgi:DNA ligase (NAD+)